jgi:hypothetical protein
VTPSFHFTSPVGALSTPVSSVQSILNWCESASAHSPVHSSKPWTILALACSVRNSVLLSAVVLQVSLSLVVEGLVIRLSHNNLEFRYYLFLLNTVAVVTDLG